MSGAERWNIFLQVLVFETLADRKEFSLALNEFLQTLSIQRHEVYLAKDEFYNGAVLFEQRQKILQNFFRTAFDQVYFLYINHTEKLRMKNSFVLKIGFQISKEKKLKFFTT